MLSASGPSAWRQVALAAPRGDVLRRSPGLRRLLAAALVSAIGDRLHQVAMATLVLALTGSMTQAGLVFVVSTLPYVLFGLFAGAFVDRWDRRTALVWADLARAGLVLLVPVVAPVSLGLVYVLLFATTCAAIVFNPAERSAIPDLVEPEDLASANTLFQTVRYVSELVGYPIAGALLTVLVGALGPLTGTAVAFGLDAASFLGSALLLLGLPPLRSLARDATTSLLRQAGDGLRFLRQQRVLRANTALLTLGPLFLGSLHTLWIGFAWRVSGTEAAGLATTETVYALGTMLGLWSLGVVQRRLNKGRTILLGFVVMGLAVLEIGFTQSLLVASALAAVAGVGNMLFLIPSITLVQEQTPRALRGRVFGVRLALTYAAFSVSNATAGYLSDVIGVSPLLVALGAAMVVVGVLGFAAPSARDAR